MQKQEKRSFSRISFKERVIIEQRYCKDEYSMAKIAKELGRPSSAVTREIGGKGRHGNGRYRAEVSQRKHDEHASHQGRRGKLKHNSKLLTYTVEKLKLEWSPEQISIRLPLDYKNDESMRISYEAIYQYIYNQVHRDGYGYTKPGCADLRKLLTRRHKRRTTKGLRKAQKLERLESLPSIEARPSEVDRKRVIGHWEGDTLVSKQSLSRIKSMNERVSGIVFFEKTLDGSSTVCNEALITRLSHVPHKYRKTITQDRGSENRNYINVEQALGVVCYFAHPYASYERGANENANGLLRRFFPKKTDFALVRSEDIKKAEYLINSRPRVRLKGLTPYEYFYKKTGVALDS